MIPTYNQAWCVGRAVESALAQTYENIEIVVADDASTDETQAVVAGYSSCRRLRYVRNASRLGRVANYRRILFEEARGDWVLNLDGDDYLADVDFVSDAMGAASAHGGVVGVIGGYRIVVSGGRSRIELPTRSPVEVIEGREFFRPPFRPFVAAHLSTLYSRRVAIELGFYRHDVPNSDWESLIRLALAGRLVLFGRVVGVWQLHGGNTSSNLTRDDIIANFRIFTAPYDSLLRAGVERQHAEVWRDRSLAVYAAANAPLVASGRPADAWAVMQALKAYPRAYRLMLGHLLASPKLWGQWLLLCTGGRRLLLAAQLLWRWAAWR
ncbi:MAG TPA: glycosyltransferase family 2 protein [Vicinamibacterales bacterium]|nr:glycosyltransferase family 2 protein [Vicinamibacterales bacterium]